MNTHQHNLENWQHTHDFDIKTDENEKRTRYVLILTAITMVIEIVAGSVYGSMALLADGWHMATHVAAFAIAIFTYRYARKHADNPAFSFGTGKVNVLGGFASAMALAVVALMMLIESIQRFFEPQTIHFNEAIIVAIVGLLVNIASAFLLKHDHSHDHGHGHHNAHHAHHDHDEENHTHASEHDHNLRAAYVHVLTDALTSLLAILALVIGKYSGWYWLDPVMGIVGAIIITRWAYGLLRTASPILLDANQDQDYINGIREVIEDDDEICDLHIWQVGPNHFSAIISIVTQSDRTPAYYKDRLSEYPRLAHVTVEVNACEGERCVPV